MIATSQQRRSWQRKQSGAALAALAALDARDAFNCTSVQSAAARVSAEERQRLLLSWIAREKRKRMESVSLQISTWKFYGLYFPSFRTKS
jgi:hypothetical protein